MDYMPSRRHISLSGHEQRKAGFSHSILELMKRSCCWSFRQYPAQICDERCFKCLWKAYSTVHGSGGSHTNRSPRPR